MKSLAIFILTCMFFGISMAQNEIDSLKGVWANKRYEDSTRLEALNTLIIDTVGFISDLPHQLIESDPRVGSGLRRYGRHRQ